LIPFKVLHVQEELPIALIKKPYESDDKKNGYIGIFEASSLKSTLLTNFLITWCSVDDSKDQTHSESTISHSLEHHRLARDVRDRSCWVNRTTFAHSIRKLGILRETIQADQIV
jgi:hypothetical protein